MKFLTSRVVVSAIASFIAFAIVPAIATTPEADFKTVTSKAYVDSLISNNDISGHKVNGAPLSNAASYFYGEGVGAESAETKTVSIPSITGAPAVGQVIIVRPATTNTSSTIKIKLNNTTAYSVLYRGSANGIPKEAWTAYVPSIFVLDETSGGTKYWRYVGTSPVAMTWSASETAAANAYSTTFDGTTGNWPVADESRYVKGDSFAQGLALKQNRITTNLVSFNDTLNGATYNVPALVSYGTGTNNADGILGNKIGIVGYENIGGDLGDYTGVGMDNYVPTVYAVAAALYDIWDSMPSQWHALSWVVSGDNGVNRTNAINAYNTEFGNGTNQWAGSGADLINGQFLANSLALKQNKIPAGTSGEILTYSGTEGQLGTPWGVLSSIGGNDLDAVEFYSTTFDGTDGNWATSSAGKLITTNILAEGLALKQTKIFAKSTGNYEPRGGQTIELDTLGNPGIRYITPSMDGAVSTHGLTTKSGAPSVWDYIDGSQDLTTFTNNTFGTTTGITLARNKKYVMGALVTLDLLKEVYAYINTTIDEDLHGAAGEVPVYDNDGFINGLSRAIYSGPTAQAPYNATNDADKLAAASFVETKQNKLPAQASGAPVTIPTYPAYGESDGAIGKMYLDTSSLYTTDNTHFPSSKLVATTLDLYVRKRDAWNTAETNEWLGATSDGAVASVSGLYLIPGLADSGTGWARNAMGDWGDKKTVPTMDTLAKSLAGLYNAVGDLIGNQILDHDGTSSNLSGASVPVPSQITYTGDRFLNDGNQLFWLPQLSKDGVQEATRLLKTYSAEKIVPSMDELAYALDGVLQTHETTSELQAVLNYYNLREISLFKLADMINDSEANAVALHNSGYLQTFAPTLEALMNESYALYKLIDTKQDMLPAKSAGNAAPKGNQAVVLNANGYPSNVYTTAGKNLALTAKSGAQMVMNYVDGTTASSTFASSQGLSEANVKAALVSLELLKDVYTTIDTNKQQVMPGAGKYIDSHLDTVEISDYTNSEVKGEEVVTSTNMAGAVGKRQIFEAGTTYTNDAATNIQIATIGAVMENTFTKVCVEYAPGSTQNDTTCWLWQFRSNVCSANGVSCQSSTECCSGFCDGGGTNSREPGVCKELDGLCQGEGQSCSRSADCCDGLTCDSRSSTCVGNTGNNSRP